MDIALKRENNYLHPESADIRLRENETFVKYMYTNLDMAEAEKTIMTADQKYIDSLQEVVDANVKISVKTSDELSERTQVYYEYPIVKHHGGEKRMLASPSENSVLPDKFEVFPIPSTGLININYYLSTAVGTGEIQIYDVTGKKVKTISNLGDGSNTLQLDLSSFDNGLYTCKFAFNNQQKFLRKISILK